MADGLQLEIPVPLASAPPLEGAVLFLAAEERARVAAELVAKGATVARVDAIAVTSRGRLAELIDAAVARALVGRGLRPAAAVRAIDLVHALPPQARGLAIFLGSLRALIDEDGALDADDSRTVRALAKATSVAPLVLALDAADATLDAYAPPVPLASLLLPPRIATPPATDADADADADSEAEAEAEADSEAAITPVTGAAIATPVAAPIAAPERAVRTAVTAPAPPSPTPIPLPPLPAPEIWRPWVVALAGARGPQPLGSFERLFAQAYMPLARALEDGLDDSRAEQACDEFRRNFSRAYTEACPTFAVTGKRPRMVFDAPDLASKVARLHGARTTQLLLVDGMRFDVGLRVRDLLTRDLDTRASLAEEQILWSALPSTTGRQLDLLAHGIDAMRAQSAPESEAEPMRGRTAETIRRVKIGHRDVYKLDAVQSRLTEATSAHELREMAANVAEAIQRHTATLAARTLLYVFGDHGFARDRAGVVTQGGASPEEVLVPAFSFLVGAVH